MLFFPKKMMVRKDCLIGHSQLLLWMFLIFSGFSLGAQSPIFNVRDFGASGDAAQYARPFLQKAIDACHAAGGGQVLLPAGAYTTGTIVLKDNVDFHLATGATLYASQQEKDYENDFVVYKKNDSGKLPGEGTPVLIYAKGAKHISITGKGTIHGQARRTYEPLKSVDGFIAEETENARNSGVEMKMYYKVKPYTCMVFLEDCTDIRVQDVSMIESTDWTLHFKWCERAFVDGVYIFSSLEQGVNADGIDIDGSKDVVVSNCTIITGDDSIVLKSTITGEDYRACENITVTNCSLVSTSTGLKLGTESHGDFRHITFSNCVIRNSNRGLSIVVRDGATVSDVLFSNITIECDRKHFNWWGNGDPIWLVLKRRFPDSKLGKIQNVTFQNIQARGQGTSKIEGYPGEQMLENIRLYNVQLTLEAEDKPDKRTTHGFEAHDVDGLILSDFTINWDNTKGMEPKWDAAVALQQVMNVEMDRVRGKQAAKGSAIRLTDVQNAYITNTLPQPGTATLFEVSGAESRNLVFRDNDPMGIAAQFLATGKEVEKEAINLK